MKPFAGSVFMSRRPQSSAGSVQAQPRRLVREGVELVEVNITSVSTMTNGAITQREIQIDPSVLENEDSDWVGLLSAGKVNRTLAGIAPGVRLFDDKVSIGESFAITGRSPRRTSSR